MKIIDLLNKIANGETLPQKIMYYGSTFEYCDRCKQFESVRDNGRTKLYEEVINLNDEVEIIEDTPKKIEPFTKREIEVYHDMIAPIDDLAHKVSEIIDYINEGKNV